MAKNALPSGRAQTELDRLAADAAMILRSMPASGVIVVD
ncbi:MAG: hypothetical protein QOH13_1602, partial [Thermoleophilaceae bacterium]|nr:hypothetical protein [Thermoleophilaceae bacterium]